MSVEDKKVTVKLASIISAIGFIIYVAFSATSYAFKIDDHEKRLTEQENKSEKIYDVLSELKGDVKSLLKSHQ